MLILSPRGAINRPQPTTPRDQAFTIIEMIVVMLLMGIVTTMVARVLLDKLAAQHKSVTTQRATAAGNEVISQLGDDLRSARAPDRDPAKIGDAQRLREAVLGDAVITDASDAAVTLDVRDIISAEPSRLQFRSDVVPEAGGAATRVECITYEVRSDGSFWRAVNDFDAASRTCTGPLRLETRLLPSPNP